MKKYIFLFMGLVCFYFTSAQTDTTILRQDTLIHHKDSLYITKDTLSAKNKISDTAFVKKDSILFNSINNDYEEVTYATSNKNKTIYGVASFYSRNLEGSVTSTGEKFYHDRYTAASNNFKLGTWVKVTNLKNNKSVVVRINDHMHPRMQKKGRVVDLSIAAARKLDFIKQGITKVKVEIVTSHKSK